MASAEGNIGGAVREATFWLADDGVSGIDVEDASVLLVRTVAALLGRDLRPYSRWQALANEAAELLVNRSRELAAHVAEASGGRPADVERLLERHTDRLAGLAADLLTSKPLAPPTRMVETNWEPAGEVGAVLFQAWAHSSHEFWPLMVDGLAATDLREVVAAHVSWLDGDRITRAVWYDVAADRLVESALSEPVIPARVLFIAGGRSERATHAALDELFADRLHNRAQAAVLLDDKWATAKRWREMDVPTPVTWLLSPQAQPDTLSRILVEAGQESDRLVVKPRFGTEARGVEIVDLDARQLQAALQRGGGELVVQPFRGSLRYRDEALDRRAVLRLNAALDPLGAASIESGYVHVAASDTDVASAGSGGVLRPLMREHLAVDDGGELNADDVADVERLAAAAAQALVIENGALRLAALDILVERTADGNLEVLALEANPRPAGLGHSRFVTKGWERAGEPGVSTCVWSE